MFEPAGKSVARQLPHEVGDEVVLLVEDSEVNQIVITQMLTEMGLFCVLASNGAEAVDHFRTSDARLIIMDISMPVMDGYEATAQIREIERECELLRTPIIGVTAHALAGAREKCLEAGMDDYLSKPVSMDEMRLMIDRWLDIRRNMVEGIRGVAAGG